MNKPNMRPCPQCGRNMVVKKGKAGGKFWACTGYRDGCTSTLEYFGDGARAGLDLDIREIENGYILTISHKYAESPDEDAAKEIYCIDKDTVKSKLIEIFAEESDYLHQRIEQVDGFIEEANVDTPRPITKRESTSDIKTLLKRVSVGHKKAAELNASELLSGDEFPD